jgi:peptide/nickel transport system substrate-binding protein
MHTPELARHQTRLSRRAALGILLSATSAALLAACGTTSQAPSTSATVAPAAAPKPTTPPASALTTSVAAPTAAAQPAQGTAVPRPGGTLRVGMVGDITALDGFVWSPNNSNTIGQVWDQLITYDENFVPQPRLAESWELSPDNTQIKFNLRRGVQFHNGRELTSDDIKYTLQRARDPKTTFNSTVGPGASFWSEITTPDKYTIVLASDRPRPGAFDSILYLRILDQESVQAPDAQTRAVGTGPFKFTEWAPGDHLTLAKNPNYWEPGLPYLDQVQVRVFKDQSSMVVAQEAGALDMAFAPPIPDATRLQSDKKYQVYNNYLLGQYFYLQLNVGFPPMDNKVFRQAIGFAIDRQRFTDSIMGGFAGEPRALPWPPQSLAWQAEKNAHYTLNLDKARALVEQSGVTDPSFDLSYPLASFAGEYASLAQIIQSDLARIGVPVTLKPLDISAFTQAGQGAKPAYQGARLSGGAFTNVGEPTSHFILSSTFGAAINSSGYYDDDYKALVASVGAESDVNSRKQGYSKINDYLLDAAYCHVISGYPNILVQGANVRDLGYYPVLQWTLRRAWLG